MTHTTCSPALTGMFLVSIAVAGCDAGTGAGEASTTAAGTTATTISLPIPRLLQGRAIIQDALQAEMTVNGQSAVVRQVGGSWSASFSVLPGANIEFSLVWYQVYTGNFGLTLATLDEIYAPITEESSIQIDDSRYVTSGTGFDLDSDGISNLEELNEDTDPFDAASPGRNRAIAANASKAGKTTGNAGGRPERVNGSGAEADLLVEIPRIAAAQAPVIDGLAEGVWDNARYVDTTGALLRIDNLVAGGDKDGVRSDQHTEFRWRAMHDGSNLFLFVRGEAAELATPSNDSLLPPGALQDDDSLELFFDGNNSRFTRFDSVDDTHMVIGLLDEEGNTSGRVQNGIHAVVGLPSGMQFFNCLCSPQYSWEVSIPLASLNIKPGTTFGMELQINDDIDGGSRDSTWAWFNPSGLNATFANPSVMGRVLLSE